jgi:hypothetical protein
MLAHMGGCTLDGPVFGVTRVDSMGIPFKFSIICVEVRLNFLKGIHLIEL